MNYIININVTLEALLHLLIIKHLIYTPSHVGIITEREGVIRGGRPHDYNCR